jgi:thiol-disulfide isomerase/thioredoxin
LIQRLVLLLAVLGALTACGVTPPNSNNSDPSIARDRQRAGIENCPAGTTTAGGLPSITLPCLGGGGSVDLASLKGPLLINAWSSTCGPCRDEMPALQAFHRKYGAKVPILGVDYLDTPDLALVINTAHVRGVTYPMVVDQSGQLAPKLGFHNIPATFLLTASGQVKLVQMGGMDSENEVARKVTAALGHAL